MSPEYRLNARTERWRTPDGDTAIVEVRNGIVEVSYELLAQMLTDLGMERVET